MARYSLHFQLIDPNDQALARSNFAFDPHNSIAVKGPQKLINRWLQMFFVPRGSDPLFPGRGTTFATMIGGNVLFDDLRATIEVSVLECNEQLREIDGRSPWLEPSEKLGNASISYYNQPRQDAVELWVEIQTLSGERVESLIAYISQERASG